MSGDLPDLRAMTADDWTSAILRALKAHDVKAVASLVGGMAVYHPRPAETIRQALLLGIDISRRAER